ncbi:histidinol-phosphatase HisJ family protein [Isachenkonia alkalipeptolytica]|uniref:Histidinol-phosphatase n=1 Tax=Isachenkonia alkalipeptolytica TaxID=2565777 RepID=A0AA43XL74_9CLOT|nr:histidinol-phosphatase HisJ family protein [Isachenkonia alkalipeptolytica]NBG87905.1 histidinol-phosphatase HisJ family protein [Isachenkonia alkalipeptolytica]
MFDSHVHSNFSPDSAAPMVDTIEESIKKGLSSICFTDHYDLDYDGKDNDLTFDIDQYFHTLGLLKEKYRDRIDVRVGIELGLQPHLVHRYHTLFKDIPFDFILASIHSVDREDFYSGNFFDHRSQLQAYNDYFSELKQCLATYDHFQSFGHIDVIKRYGNYPHTLPLSSYRDILREIFTLLIEKGKGIELNTSGLRYGLGDFHPSVDILKEYKALGGELITLGSDSHVVGGTGTYFPEALEILESLGFKYYTSFKNQQPVFHKITDSL